ncbi:phosphopantetheine-binding protein, partial [Methylorubrum sp. POS3]|uniref:phosphopantetheine-binding protein n=3 Tax=Methylorubrum TaxID=2282523 RepID=UPI00372A9404
EAHLVAYVAGRGPAGDAAQGEADLAAILSAHLAARLPAHLRPSVIVELAALPRLASGKLDRSGLPAPDWRGRDAAPPQGATETALAGLWTALLGVERVGRTDGFFERGGHSLLAAKLVARIREEMGVHIGLPAFYAAPTLAALAALIDSDDEARARDTVDALLTEWEEV